MTQPDKVVFHEISDGPDHAAIYTREVVHKVGAKSSYSDIVEQYVQSDTLPSGQSRPAAYRPRFERLLDINAEPGDNVYVFRLNAEIDGQHRLEFDEVEPIVPIGIHYPGSADAISEVHRFSERWAAFRFDASKIGLLPEMEAADESNSHPAHLRVPFCLNVIDPVAGVSPWVFAWHGSEQADAPPDDETSVNASTNGGVHPSPFTHGGVHPSAFTHGGVHPSALSYMIVSL